MLWISVKSFAFKMVTELHWQFSKVGYLEESLVGDFFNDKWNWFLCSDDWNFNRVWWIHGLHFLHFLRQKPLSKILICMVLQFAPMLCTPQKCVGRWIRLVPLYFRGKSTSDFQFLRRQWIYPLSVRTSC